MEDLNSHLALTVLKNSIDKLVCFDNLTETFSIIKIGGGQVSFSNDEALAFVEYINKVQSDKAQQQINDLYNSIKQTEQRINDYNKELVNLNNQIQGTKNKLSDAFNSENVDMVASCNGELQNLKKQQDDLVNKITNKEEYIKKCQIKIGTLQNQ